MKKKHIQNKYRLAAGRLRVEFWLFKKCRYSPFGRGEGVGGFRNDFLKAITKFKKSTF